MKLLVGLGNIGSQYHNTRHNIGFQVVERFIEKYAIGPSTHEPRFFGSIAYGHWNGEKIIVLKPHTYMNASGKSVQAVTQFYKIHPSDICVFYDDIDLPFESIRVRTQSGSGGHNGIKSIQQCIGNDFLRIKIGVGNEQKSVMGASAFVLGKWTTEESEKLPNIVEKVIEMYETHCGL